jgi:type II protein arginine methyltransferase
MDSGASIAVEYFVSDIENGAPALELRGQSIAESYDSLCLPLTTEKWKSDWMRMCLQPGDKRESKRFASDAQKETEKWRKNPVFEKDHVTISTLRTLLGFLPGIEIDNVSRGG